MNSMAQRFREEAEEYNKGRSGVQRRYSGSLRHKAISYSVEKRREGASWLKIAQELGISGWTLARWVSRTEIEGEIKEVEIITEMKEKKVPGKDGLGFFTPEGYRVEGLSLEKVRSLLQSLR